MSPHTGQVPWAKHGFSDAHMATLDNGWYLFIVKSAGQWSWNVNAPGGGGHLTNEQVTARQGLKDAEQRGGTLERGKTARDAKGAAEKAARRSGVIA